ncbi:SET domain-containing protein [Phytophthora infestans]|uniref:SET domain-containing protein n=1 Tax=Phytophthora infestans TaxID=4787 RepID=A0A833WGY9_PHYIN|nr:SET domain-containing protein [Phytophthora infestans]KAF4148739.1 SET domain-containing protein [Phytophthora infestans]
MVSGNALEGEDRCRRNVNVKQELLEKAEETEKEVLTYSERAKRGKKQKARLNPYGVQKSRKMKHRKQRKPVRDSARVYNARPMKAMLAKAYILVPGVREELEEFRRHLSDYAIDLPPPEVIAIDDDEFDLWPEGVDFITECTNEEENKFGDLGDLGTCECERYCFRDTCTNALAGVFCTAENCPLNGRIYECKDLELVNRDGAGTGVRATADICAGSILGEYTGRLTTEDLENAKGPKNEYALGLQLKSTRRKSVFIDAARCGNITRTMNHSCDATCQFVEVRNRRQVKVVVVAKRRIGEGSMMRPPPPKTTYRC